MKCILQRNLKLYTFALFSTVVFSGCGGGETNWGIDGRQIVPQSANCQFEEAIEVEPAGVVTPLEEDTQIRVWHFQNSQEFICVLKGSATIQQPIKGK